MDAPSSGNGASRSSGPSDRAGVQRGIVDTQVATADLDHKYYARKTRRNAKSPFLVKLPVEVISDIFVLVNESQNEQNTDLLPASLLLGKICKAWREIAWARPRLWSFISIRLGPDNCTTQERLLREWIGRSGNALLHIFMTFSKTIDPKTMDHASVVKLLVENCSRWKTLVVRPFPALSAELEKGHNFPNLSFVQINGQRRDGLKYDFAGAPQLQGLQLSKFDPLGAMNVGWDKLTTVNVEYPFLFGDALTMFKRLKAVDKLRLHLDRTTRNLPTDSAPQTSPNNLPNLSDLQILSTGEGIRCLFNNTATPALSTLAIAFVDVVGGGPVARGFEQLYHRSGFALSHLSLDGLDIKEADLASMLELSPSLHSLSLALGRKANLSTEMINRFNPMDSATSIRFLPLLTEFNYTGSISFALKALEDMVKYRHVFSQNPNFPNKVLRNLNITYRNKSWASTSNQACTDPNALQAFYRRKLDIYEARGTTINLVWDEDARPRLDSDSD